MGRTNPGGGRHNLPLFATSFLGRERAIAAIRRLLRRARLVTLCGPDGCGKTRLAIEATTRQVGLQPDGTWLVDLAPLSAPDLVPEAAASVLRIRAAPNQSTMDALVNFMADRRLLLVLDGCEHLVDACSTLAASLVAACPRVRLLATSRQPLDVPGEVCRYMCSVGSAGAGQGVIRGSGSPYAHPRRDALPLWSAFDPVRAAAGGRIAGHEVCCSVGRHSKRLRHPGPTLKHELMSRARARP